MNKRTLLVLAVLSFLIALLLMWFGLRPASAADDQCAYWDAFTGGERFAYSVDTQGIWNLPGDAQNWLEAGLHDENGLPMGLNVPSVTTLGKAAIWKFYSEKMDATVIIVFLSLEPTQPPGSRLGQHKICVEKLPGLGMGG